MQNQPQTILLLDVDGVLIRGRGYRAAIQATLRHCFQQMGQEHLSPPQEADILAFEAQSIIFEWDYGAICLAQVLWQAADLLGPTLENSIQALAASGRNIPQPDWQALARACLPAQAGIRPGAAALGHLFPTLPALVEVLGQTHSPDAPIMRGVQNFVLGHELFQEVYGLTPLLQSPPLLQTLDVPLLTPASRERLRTTPDLYPIIYTARPSYPPRFIMERAGYSPEAELGRELLGWEDCPLAAYGQMVWLAQGRGLDSDALCKPSPVHARFAIFQALLSAIPQGERRAIELTWDESALPAELTAHPWRVIVLEDSPNSIHGVRGAVEALARHHAVTCVAVGIASEPHNIQQLAQVADHIAPDVNAGLAWALGW